MLTPFCKTFLKLKKIVWCLNIKLKTIIFQCSKNYASPTRWTRLKLALIMADPTVLTKTYRSLKVPVDYLLGHIKIIPFKGNRLSCNEWSGLPCLVQLFTLYTCRTTVNFGTLKDGSLWINSLASKMLSYKNFLQNGVTALSNMVLTNRFFLIKKNCGVRAIRLCSNVTSMWYRCF